VSWRAFREIEIGKSILDSPRSMTQRGGYFVETFELTHPKHRHL